MASRRRRSKLHFREWGAELLGTALLLFGGLSAVCLDFGRGSPVAAHIPSVSTRLLITGLLFAGTGSLVAVSPLGRLSGGHINPAVTMAFWLTKHVHSHDLVGYVVSQCLGAVLGVVALRIAWGPIADDLRDGLTQPGNGLSDLGAAAIEAVMTALMILTIFLFVSNMRTMRWTPVAVWILVAGLVWVAAPYTGTSLNPARSLGPAVVVPTFHAFWVYVVGPILGALAAVGISSLLSNPRRLLTAKLFHDARYPCVFRSFVPTSRGATAT